MTMTAKEWLSAYSEVLGIDAPSDEEVELLLALAGSAAHSSERTAAPIACWLAARAGLEAGDAKALADALEERLKS
ncbi:MAG: DUF6457 domain-containing protein [Acidimicrobiales bacterium]